MVFACCYRVRLELHGGAWCPQEPATTELKEWLEIDFRSVHLITASEIQGRFGNGQGAEFAEHYMLEYWRPRLSKWIRYRNRQNEEVLTGNINTYLEKKNELDPPIIASKVRFFPYSYHKRTVCMRVELYGCKWTDGIVSYSMPQGDKKGQNWEFYDTAYDGHWDGEKLRHGLGHLTDGKVAPEDFKVPLYDHEVQGWVGWKNDSRENRPIEITFEFDKVREFSAVHIYANNQFTKDVQVFSSATVQFSVGGKIYKGEPITYDYMEDCIFETPHNISIKLHHRVGRFVKLQLHFANRWMLLSEITFDSTVVTGNFTEEEEDIDSYYEQDTIQRDQIATPGFDNNKNLVSAVNTPTPLGQYLGIVVGFLAVIIVLMLGGVAFICIQHRRYKSSPRPSQVPGGCDKAALYREPPDPEYAVPLQQPQQSPRAPPMMHNFFPKPPSIPPPSERYYAATEICNTGFVPPPPPTSTPPPVRLSRQPRYASNPRAFMNA